MLQAKPELHSWPRCFWAAVQPARLSRAPQLFLENNNGKRKLGLNKKGESVQRSRSKQKKNRQRHVCTYLICPNLSALWLDKSLRRARCAVSHCYKQAWDSCSQRHQETGELNKYDRNPFRRRMRQIRNSDLLKQEITSGRWSKKVWFSCLTKSMPVLFSPHTRICHSG